MAPPRSDTLMASCTRVLMSRSLLLASMTVDMLPRRIDACQYVAHAGGTDDRGMLSTGALRPPRGRRRRASGAGAPGSRRPRPPPAARDDLVSARERGVRVP